MISKHLYLVHAFQQYVIPLRVIARPRAALMRAAGPKQSPISHNTILQHFLRQIPPFRVPTIYQPDLLPPTSSFYPLLLRNCLLNRRERLIIHQLTYIILRGKTLRITFLTMFNHAALNLRSHTRIRHRMKLICHYVYRSSSFH